ncbi:hypothetical protein BDW62DRAFT_177403 [Aspergillus aurantiobrunneus]
MKILRDRHDSVWRTVWSRDGCLLQNWGSSCTLQPQPNIRINPVWQVEKSSMLRRDKTLGSKNSLLKVSTSSAPQQTVSFLRRSRQSAPGRASEPEPAWRPAWTVCLVFFPCFSPIYLLTVSLGPA